MQLASKESNNVCHIRLVCSQVYMQGTVIILEVFYMNNQLRKWRGVIWMIGVLISTRTLAETESKKDVSNCMQMD